MELLRAVNRILGEIGEHPVTSIEAKNPTVTVILQAIDTESRTTQSKGWWFNKYKVELFPDPDGVVYLPYEVLSWESIGTPSVVRGNTLLNPEGMVADWRPQGVTKLEGNVTRFIEFEDLPHSFQEWVVVLAGIRAFTNDLGMEETIKLFFNREADAAGRVMAEHLRHKRYSTMKSNMFQRITSHIWR